MVVGKDNVRVILTMPRKMKEELEKEAVEDNRSLSNYIITLIQKCKEDKI